MKRNLKCTLAALLAGLLLFSATSCSTGDDPTETRDPNATQAETEADTGYRPDIETKDYDCEFVITGAQPIAGWAVAGEDSAGDPFLDSIYERGVRIKDHLGKDKGGVYHVAYNDNPGRTLAMLEKVNEMRHAEYAYFWVPFTDRMDKVVPFEEGKALMKLTTTTGFTGLRGASIRFGVLPYPMFDEAQGEYLSLSWNGLLMIPGSIKQPDMVSDVVELPAYYTAPVKTAFYEDLLGSKLADAPEDADMLNVIWDSQSNDVCLITAEDGNRVWVDLLYMVPTLCTDGIDQYASYLRSRTKNANKIIDELFNPTR